MTEQDITRFQHVVDLSEATLQPITRKKIKSIGEYPVSLHGEVIPYVVRFDHSYYSSNPQMDRYTMQFDDIFFKETPNNFGRIPLGELESTTTNGITLDFRKFMERRSSTKQLVPPDPILDLSLSETFFQHLGNKGHIYLDSVDHVNEFLAFSYNATGAPVYNGEQDWFLSRSLLPHDEGMLTQFEGAVDAMVQEIRVSGSEFIRDDIFDIETVYDIADCPRSVRLKISEFQNLYGGRLSILTRKNWQFFNDGSVSCNVNYDVNEPTGTKYDEFPERFNQTRREEEAMRAQTHGVPVATEVEIEEGIQIFERIADIHT